MEPESFELLKSTLVGEYFSFYVVEETSITKEILAEKACDYFEKLEIKTGKSFDKHIDSYVSALDDIVGPHIAKAPQTKKKGSEPIAVPRARKYYEKALFIKNARVLSAQKLLDYTRIMMCLYAAIINNGGKEITNLDFSVQSLNAEALVGSMKNEQESIAGVLAKKNRFNTKELYSSDSCTFVMAIMLLHKITGNVVQGD